MGLIITIAIYIGSIGTEAPEDYSEKKKAGFIGAIASLFTFGFPTTGKQEYYYKQKNKTFFHNRDSFKDNTQ